MLDTLIKLKVSVHRAAKMLVPLTFVRLEHAMENENTCAQLLEHLLRENNLEKIADKLDKCDVVFKCFRTIGVQNLFASTRTIVSEEMVATMFYMDTLGDTLKETESHELLFVVSTPSPIRPFPIVNATDMLMRHAISPTLLPPRKAFTRMTDEHDLYNVILDYVAEQGLGWAMEHLSSASEFLKHITSGVWALNEKVNMLTMLYDLRIYF